MAYASSFELVYLCALLFVFGFLPHTACYLGLYAVNPCKIREGPVCLIRLLEKATAVSRVQDV